MRVLVVEDEDAIASAIEQKTEEGFAQFTGTKSRSDENFLLQKDSKSALPQLQSSIADRALHNIPASKLEQPLRIRVTADKRTLWRSA